MTIGGIGYSQTYYNTAVKKFVTGEKDSEAIADNLKEENCASQLADVEGQRRDMQELLRVQFGMRDEEIEAQQANYPSAVPKRGEGAPYSYLANEKGVIEYKGVVFTLDHERQWLCLGDMSNMDDVIRIPLSQGGCLMVNRNSIDALGRAIGMFSPEDVNRILRALKMDAKIQEMKKEIEEMEDGVGKSNEEKYADSAEAAKKAAKENGNADGFNGYGLNAEEKGTFRLKEWQLEMLLGEEEEETNRVGTWYEPILELAKQQEEGRDERDF